MEASDERRERLITTLTEAGGSLRVRNALNPILWLCGLLATPCFIVIGWSKEPPIGVWVILYGVVGTALFSFLYLLFFDRNRLHSEEYLICRQTLELIEEKGSKKAIDAATVHAISQDEFLKLPDARGDKTP